MFVWLAQSRISSSRVYHTLLLFYLSFSSTANNDMIAISTKKYHSHSVQHTRYMPTNIKYLLTDMFSSIRCLSRHIFLLCYWSICQLINEACCIFSKRTTKRKDDNQQFKQKNKREMNQNEMEKMCGGASYIIYDNNIVPFLLKRESNCLLGIIYTVNVVVLNILIRIIKVINKI